MSLFTINLTLASKGPSAKGTTVTQRPHDSPGTEWQQYSGVLLTEGPRQWKLHMAALQMQQLYTFSWLQGETGEQ